MSNYKEDLLDSFLTTSRLLHPITKYEDAFKNGQYTNYYDNGIKMEEGYFKNWKFHGEWKTWHPNGQLCWKGSYSNGKQVGKWTEWDSNGNKILEFSYRDGDLIEHECKVF